MTLYFIHGKTFDNEDDFLKFAREWPDMPCDMDEFKIQMEVRIREIQINLMARDGNLTNKEAYQILRLATDWSVWDEKEILSKNF